MALPVIEIGKPADAFDPDELVAVLVNPVRRGGQRVMVRNPELPISARDARTKPYPVVPDKREHLLVGDGVHIPDNQELLFVLHELGNVFAKQRKRRIGHHDVRLSQKPDAFRAAEIAVALQWRDAYVLDLGKPLAVAEAVIFELDRPLEIMPRKQVDVLVPVAGRYQLLQSKVSEFQGEILEEIADRRIVAIAIDRLPPELVPVVRQFFLNVGKLRIEFVAFGGGSGIQAGVLDRAGGGQQDAGASWAYAPRAARQSVIGGQVNIAQPLADHAYGDRLHHVDNWVNWYIKSP